MKTAICESCKSKHSNTGGTPILQRDCFNCGIIKEVLYQAIEGINRHIPMSGRKRKLTVTGFKIDLL